MAWLCVGSELAESAGLAPWVVVDQDVGDGGPGGSTGFLNLVDVFPLNPPDGDYGNLDGVHYFPQLFQTPWLVSSGLGVRDKQWPEPQVVRAFLCGSQRLLEGVG